MDALDIGVVGCGSAGAAAAMFLARAGHTVSVYERVADPRPVGAGITLQPTGQAVLARLGLLAPIVERGARLDRLLAIRHGGKRLVDLRYADIDPEMFGLGLHRGTLFSVLYQAVRREPGVTVRLDAGCTSIARDAGGVTVHGCDGTLGRHAFVIVADGSVSELHGSAGVPVKAQEYPWGALWFVGDDLLAAATSLPDALAAYSRARRRHLRHYQFMTRVLTPMFQSSSRLLGWMRDAFMPISGRFGPVYRMMVRTMIGLEQGIVRRPLPLASAASDRT